MAIQLRIALGGATYRVRYIGMDTPERDDFFFSEATDANRALVNGKTVFLVNEVQRIFTGASVSAGAPSRT